MAFYTILIRSFPYGPNNDFIAYKDDVVDLDDEDVERAIRFGAIDPDEVNPGPDPDPDPIRDGVFRKRGTDELYSFDGSSWSLLSVVSGVNGVAAEDGEVTLTPEDLGALGVTPNADASAIKGGGVFVTDRSAAGYGDMFTIGNAPGSVGFPGQPTAAPATTVGSGGVTLPVGPNGVVPVADCAQLNQYGGSFTVGGFIVSYKGRSASSGPGNATGAFTVDEAAAGSFPEGTALGFQTVGFGPHVDYHVFGDRSGSANRPVHGSTQGMFGIASYRGPTVDDSAEGGSWAAILADTGVPFEQHKPVTGFEMIGQVSGGNTLPDGYGAPLLAGGGRTNVTGTAHVKNAIGLKTSHNSSGGPFGWTDDYDAFYQASSGLESYGVLDGAATLPQGTVAFKSATKRPAPASVDRPVTVLIGPNADGVGGQVVTYTGVTGSGTTGTLTGCTGGTGTIADGSRITNNARGLNAKDRVQSSSAFLLGASGFSASMIAALRGGTDGVQSMLALTGPSNAEVAGGLTLLRLNAGAGQTRSILQAYDTGGTNRFSINAAAQLLLNGSAINLQQSGVASARIDSSGYIQPGVSMTAGAAATVQGAKIYSGPGAPTGLVGALGDTYLRTDATDGAWLYRCTTAGAAGAAVWTAKL